MPEAHFEAQRVNFAAVAPWRMERLALAASRFAAGQNPQDVAAFQAFCETHASWLDNYALFMSLADHYAGRAWCDWAPPLARRDAGALREACRQHADRIAFWKFCQWRFFEQWLALKAYANGRGIRIIGDAPIFIAYQSAEVWARQELFELDEQRPANGGRRRAPRLLQRDRPALGQPAVSLAGPCRRRTTCGGSNASGAPSNSSTSCASTTSAASPAIGRSPPSEPTAVKGRWLPGPGAALFDAVARALGPMPIIAEDLGVITPDVEALRRSFAYPGMRILQFAFGDDATHRFLPHNYEPDTVVYTGTHDNDTAAGWWTAASEQERHHARRYLGTDGHEMHWSLIRAACASVADTAVYPMQDVLGLPTECRMNFPGRSDGYWEWRFEWGQVQPWHAERLFALCELYRRDGRPRKD